MSAQHAPHTPPLWRQYLSLPHTRFGWWAVGLATPALAFMVLTNVLALPNTDNPQLEILGVSGSWGEGVLVPSSSLRGYCLRWLAESSGLSRWRAIARCYS